MGRKLFSHHTSSVFVNIFSIVLFKRCFFRIVFEDFGRFYSFDENTHTGRPAGCALRMDLNGELMNQTPCRSHPPGTSSTTELCSLCCDADWLDPKLPAMLLPACEESCALATRMHSGWVWGKRKELSKLPLICFCLQAGKLWQVEPKVSKALCTLHQSKNRDKEDQALQQTLQSNFRVGIWI